MLGWLNSIFFCFVATKNDKMERWKNTKIKIGKLKACIKVDGSLKYSNYEYHIFLILYLYSLSD